MSGPSDRVEVAVVGAGAAGLMTAIAAARARPGLRIALLEGRPRPGTKILVSGGGRCNVTNRVVRPSDFHGDRAAVARVLRRFPVAATVEFFAGLGVELRHEPEFDKLFPTTDAARTVLDALLGECARLGVELRLGYRVREVAREAGGFRVVPESGPPLSAARVVLATGGRSLPSSGSDGAGYGFARALGHTVGPTVPGLVPLVLSPHPFAGLAGVAFPAELSAWAGGRLVERVRRPALVTHFGLSGPGPMDVSRHFAWGRETGANPEVRLCVLPGREPAALDAAWVQAAGTEGRRPVGSLLADLPQRLARRVLELAAVPEETRVAELRKEDRRRLLRAATDLVLPVADTRGFNAAEVTAGGVPLSEVDLRTLESRLAPGLHLVGEILDVDGRIGGFNFQWAWATGAVAGAALAAAPRPPGEAGERG